ncbi:MAG: radical SAM protein [Pseudomonadota bacterium]|nr:radical SAM protein [Pseudomonadota bacterium]
MKYTLCITQQCNLRCDYCYIDKNEARMPLNIAEEAIDFIYRLTPPNENIDIGFFGGEPLLEFNLIKAITQVIENHPDFDRERVELNLVTNGTIYSGEIADFIEEHDIGFGISCDGPPQVHDKYRRDAHGKGSGTMVTRNIRRAIRRFPGLMVNAVYRPQTLQHLPDVVDYLASLGLTQIYLNPDFSATWSTSDAAMLPEIYDRIAERYIENYFEGQPLYINLIDSKITVILRGGYQPLERCRMGKGEMAFAANGNIFPCERLVGSGEASEHCIGRIGKGLNLERMTCHTAPSLNDECSTCGLREYCVRWCGCSNYFSSGYYNRVGPFLCASERAAVQVSYNTIETMEKRAGSLFSDHVAGDPAINSAIAQSLT